MTLIPPNVRELLPAVASALDEATQCSLEGDSEGVGRAHARAVRALGLYVLQFALGCAAVAALIAMTWVLSRG